MTSEQIVCTLLAHEHDVILGAHTERRRMHRAAAPGYRATPIENHLAAVVARSEQVVIGRPRNAAHRRRMTHEPLQRGLRATYIPEAHGGVIGAREQRAVRMVRPRGRDAVDILPFERLVVLEYMEGDARAAHVQDVHTALVARGLMREALKPRSVALSMQ